MIKTCELTKRFDQFTAVDSINLEVPAGRVLVLLGPNGAGKTTTVRLLTAILEPTSGDAWIAGCHIVRDAEHVRSMVGVLSEHHGLYPRMNAVEYLQFYGRLYGLPDEIINRRITQLLEQFGLIAVRRQRLGEYSKGMRQKLALVRTILHEPPVLLLDEPTSAMDPESARLVRDAIRGLTSNSRTVILCTHNLAEAEELADQVAIIRRGKIIYNDTLPNLKQKLLGQVEYIAHLAGPVQVSTIHLPAGVHLTGQTGDWLKFSVPYPLQDNPILLKSLINQGYPVVSFQAVSHSLEQAYLQAVNQDIHDNDNVP